MSIFFCGEYWIRTSDPPDVNRDALNQLSYESFISFRITPLLFHLFSCASRFIASHFSSKAS